MKSSFKCFYYQGWVSSGRNLFLPGHPKKSGRNLFLPVLSGQNWKKLDKTGKNYERGQKCWKKIITIYLITYKRLPWLWLKMHLVNWYCLKSWCKQSITFGLFFPVLSGQNWKKLDDNWGNLERCHKCWKKLIIILISSKKVIVSNASSWLQLFRNLIYRKYIKLDISSSSFHFKWKKPISSRMPSQFPGSNELVNSNATAKYCIQHIFVVVSLVLRITTSCKEKY